MIRTQEQIMERFNEVKDLFGIQQKDLISYMTFENAKPYLKEEYVKQVEDGKEQWEQRTDPKEEILDYLEFAYKKAENERGLSSYRSMLHFRTWIWLDNEEFYNEIVEMLDNHTEYGIPALDKIAEHYEWELWKKEKEATE